MKKNINIGLNIKFLLILFLSNVSLYLLFFPSQTNDRQICEEKEYIREGYVKIRLNAILKTDLIFQVPVTITDEKNTFLIKHAFIVKRIENETSDFISHSIPEYLIELKASDFYKLRRANKLLIYPHDLDLQVRNKDLSHEIYF